MKDQPLPESWKPFIKWDGTDPPAAIIPGRSRSLVAKLAEVMAIVERVPKRGHNQHFNYDFATESDITAALRSEMAQRSLMLFPDVQSVNWREAQTKNGIQTIACLMVKFTVRDGETGEELSFQVPGEGADSGDKCIPKAMTSALKYALLKLFLIPTGDDPERDSKGDKAPVRRMSQGVPASAPPVGLKSRPGASSPATEPFQGIRPASDAFFADPPRRVKTEISPMQTQTAVVAQVEAPTDAYPQLDPDREEVTFDTRKTSRFEDMTPLLSADVPVELKPGHHGKAGEVVLSTGEALAYYKQGFTPIVEHAIANKLALLIERKESAHGVTYATKIALKETPEDSVPF